jgi:N-acetylglucosaminyldiphosphoundecaprenol N-acetyl-beta-D-mannosaminyltransferase
MGIDQTELVEQVLDWVKQDERRTLTYANAHCLNLAAELPAYRRLLNHSDLVYVDGIGAVWAGSLLGCHALHKVTGRIWIDALCRRGDEIGLRLYLLGGQPGIAAQASLALGNRFPRLQLCGAADGFFLEKSEEQVLAEISVHHPQVLLVGMGVPAQEEWVANHRSHLPVQVCWSVGALFDYLAGVEKPVPKWLECLGLEWAWRLKENPGGKWRRYTLGIPRFVVRVIGQWLKQR